MAQFHQVTGGGSKLVLYKETSPKQPVGASGVVLSMANESFSDSPNKQQSSLIRDKRGPAKPYSGQLKLSGGLESACDAIQLGHLFRALCGDATSELQSEKSCTASVVTDKGNGSVGIPCTSHGFYQDAMISIVGTQHYDGTYLVDPGTTANEIVIAASYVSETLTTEAKVYRGRVAVITEVADGGTGSVLFTTKDYHRLSVGDILTVSGSTAYNGEHTITAVVDGKHFKASATYTAETITEGSVIGVPKFWKHTFTLPKYQPTVCFEKVLGFEAAAATNPVRQYLGCKINSTNFKLGDDSELLFTFDAMPADVRTQAEPLNASPISLPSVPLTNVESSIYIDSVRRGDVDTASLTGTYGIEQKSAVGDRGAYSRLPEGEPDIKIQLSVFLETDDLQVMSDNNVTVNLMLLLCGDCGDEIRYTLPEAELSSTSPKIASKAGLMQDFDAMAFVQDGSSILTLTIINRVASYS